MIAHQGAIHVPLNLTLGHFPSASDLFAYDTVSVPVPLSPALHALLKDWLASKGVDGSKSCKPCDGYVTGGAGTVIEDETQIEGVLTQFGVTFDDERRNVVGRDCRTLETIETEACC